GEDALFDITGTAGAVVTYTINGGSNQTITLDGTGAAQVLISGATSDQVIVLSDIILGSCNVTLSETATVTVNPIPALVSLSSNDPICEG
ncbi:hypothetical protein NHF50_15670, partial [Flavobacterium sp. NRK F10]|uniref:hypothetical protein n=1 Tax=Flavobacterium sp. NRK F10 TaxID=2954931 RepID=UPI002091CAE8